MTRSGIDLTALDPAIRPQDDLYRHVNGRWIASHEIPADRAMDGVLRALFDAAEEQVRQIIEDASAVGAADGDVRGKIGALYASFMDTERIEAVGLAPVAGELAAIAAASDHAALLRLLGELQRTGVGGAVSFWVDNDATDPDRYVAYLTQDGLGLPDESYYREDQHAEVRTAYRAHLARMLTMAGAVGGTAGRVGDAAPLADDADDAAARVLALETAIAAGHWDVVRDRDADLTYNPTRLEELVERAPGLDWAAWTAAMAVPDGTFDDVVVRQPPYLEHLARLWPERDLADWKLWAVYHLITSRAAYLHEEVMLANFDFYGRTLTGAQEPRARWKRGVSLVEGALGEAVGQVYVARHFPPAHKERMEHLVATLVQAYRQSITELDWMTETTKAKALAKLDAFTPKIGYPNRWKDYSGLHLDPADLVGNVRRASAFEHDRELAKLGKPVDREEWFMTPQTVNAYYNPGMNEIVFPAAILQPPFFDPEADDAVNYGGIGAVIGHEIGHGFDDQGSKYDGAGRLADWWTEDDRAEFERRTAALIAQYDQLSPAQLGETHRVNGALTVGENIGDLGGLSIAVTAYRIALAEAAGGAEEPGAVAGAGADAAQAGDGADRPGAFAGDGGTGVSEPPALDGLTGLQRLFLGWAQVWRSKGRDEEVARRLAVDPHSPDEWRCNAVVRNIPEFHQAFDVHEGDALYLPPDQRVSIW